MYGGARGAAREPCRLLDPVWCQDLIENLEDSLKNIDRCKQLASSLYCKGLTQSQVGDVFGEVYGKHYSKASISRMIEYLRVDVEVWLNRSLESYYPILFVDAIHIKVHRKRSVENEAFYVVMGVKEDKTRDVLGIFNRPTESATGWK